MFLVKYPCPMPTQKHPNQITSSVVSERACLILYRFLKNHFQPQTRYLCKPDRRKRNCFTTVPGSRHIYAAESSLRWDRTSFLDKMAVSVTGEWPGERDLMLPKLQGSYDWSVNGPIGMRPALRLSLDAQLNVSTALCLCSARPYEEADLSTRRWRINQYH